MRTNIEIDDRLMGEAMRSSGKRTKRAAVEAGLRLLVQTRAQGRMRRVKGQGRGGGELEKVRGSHGSGNTNLTTEDRSKTRLKGRRDNPTVSTAWHGGC